MFKRCLCVGLAVILCAAQPWGVAKAAEVTEIGTAEAVTVEAITEEATAEETVAEETVEVETAAETVETAVAETATEEAVAEEVAVETEALALSEMKLVTEGTYYVDDDGSYPFALKIQYGENFQLLNEQCKVSVWNQDVCLVDQQETESYDEHSGVWFFEDLFDAAGEYTLTVVVSKDGTEVYRQDVAVKVSDEHCYVSGYESLSTKETWVFLYAMVLAKSAEPVRMELLDKEGESVLTFNDVTFTTYEDTYDYRYAGDLLEYYVYADRIDVSASVQSTRYLKVGMYDAKIIFADGSVEIAKDVLCVTDSPCVDEVRLSYEYDNDVDSEFVYIAVDGTNVDFNRIIPVIYDGDTAVTEMVECKEDGYESSATYKLRKLADISEKELIVKVVPKDSYEVIISEPEGYDFRLNSRPNMYYAEHMFHTNKVVARFSNVPDNTDVLMNLRTGGTGNGTVLATGQAVVKGGVATVEFMNAAGKPFDFTSEEYSYYYVEANIQIGDFATVNAEQIDNWDYIDNSVYEYEVPRTITDLGGPFIKDFHITQVFYLAEDLFEEDTVLKAKLYSQEGAFLKELPVSKEYDPDFMEMETETVPAWFVSVDLSTAQPEIGATYKLELYTDEKSYGTCEIICADNNDAYAMYSSAVYDEINNCVKVEVAGYWAKELDDNKWSVRFTDEQGNTICEEAAKVTWEYSEIEGLEPIADATFVVDDSEAVDLIASYVNAYFTVLYDGQELVEFNGYNEWEHHVERKNGISVYTLRRSTEKYANADEYMGIEFGDCSVSKVLIYNSYDTTPLTTINIPADAEGEYYFTAKDLQKLSYNRKNAVYDYYVVDGDGKVYCVGSGYLGLKAVLADVKGEEDAWPYSYVKYVVENGLMFGTGVSQDGNINFSPDATLTREQFAQVLYNAEGNPAVTYSDRFSDVEAGQWYTSAVLWAAEQDIVAGIGGGKFGTGDEITREQLAVMLCKYAKMKGIDVEVSADLTKFEDYNQISDWALKQIQWANANGIINGKGKNLDPVGKATRAECATMITNYMKKFEEVK